MSNFVSMRKTMVECLLRPSGVSDPLLLDGFLDIPRELFVPREFKHIAYMDGPIALEHGRVLMSPLLLGRLLQEARIKACDTVLYLGGNTGYGPALLACFCRKIVALESDADLAQMAQKNISDMGLKNIFILHGSLNQGHSLEAPYDAIIIEGAVDTLNPEILNNLKEDGRLVKINSHHQCVTLHKENNTWIQTPFWEAHHPLLPDFKREESLLF